VSADERPEWLRLLNELDELEAEIDAAWAAVWAAVATAQQLDVRQVELGRAAAAAVFEDDGP
jgi:hypothetical protein